jgi:hypothetical protein
MIIVNLYCDEDYNPDTDGYQLKTNQEIIDIISFFGNGETEFHTVDINRLVVENDRVKQLARDL